MSLFTFEMAVVLPLLLILTDVLLIERKLTKKIMLLSIPYFFFDAFYLLVRSHANVAMGGDYSYSITHFIPNIIANFGNYILATFLGERVVAWQYGLRQVLKTHTLPVTLLLLVGVGGIAAFVVMVWKKLDKEFMRNLAFGFLFAATSLLPFLDLGNISERYGYLAAVGFAYVVVVLIQYVSHFWQNKKAFQVSGVVIGLVFLFFANWLISNELQEWAKASMITYNALAYFRIVKPDLPSGATLYVSHLPTKYGNAWIFPVGLIDGLWFIYRDDTLQIVKTDSVDESLALKHAKPTAILNKSYVFDFDKNGQMFEY